MKKGKKILLNNLKHRKNSFLHKLIRVNHAGEYSAICIYYGQKLILRKSSIINEIFKMERQEKKHFSYFKKKIKEQRVRPTILLPIWYILGISLGITTAILGKKAAMVCTSAIEEVIEKHYKEQILYLSNTELKKNIIKFRNEELKHKNIAVKYVDNSSNKIFFNKYNFLSSLIKLSCKTAIYLSKLI